MNRVYEYRIHNPFGPSTNVSYSVSWRIQGLLAHLLITIALEIYVGYKQGWGWLRFDSSSRLTG